MPSTVSERAPTPAARAEIHPSSTASNKPWGDHSIRKKPAANRPQRHDKTNPKTKTNLIGSLSLNPGGSLTTLDTATVTESAGTWYDVRVLSEGGEVTVWRGERGGAMDEILSTTSTTQTTSSRMALYNGANAQHDFDNIQLIGDSLSSTTTYAYNAANELTTMTQPDGSDVDFEYDKWGRMTKKALGTTYEATYGYRYSDKLVDVTTDWPDEEDVDYDYGPNQRRRKRTVGGVSEWYNYDSWNVINVENGSGSGSLSRTQFYVAPRSPSTLLGDVDGTNPSSGTIRTHHHDALDSTRAVYDDSKQLLGDMEFSPYGQPLTRGGIGLSDVGRAFAGTAFDTDAQMHVTPHRFLQSSSARWLSPDPLGFVDGTNLYSYAVGNPVSNTDPMGTLSGAPFVATCETAGGALPGASMAGPAFYLGAAVVIGCAGADYIENRERPWKYPDVAKYGSDCSRSQLDRFNKHKDEACTPGRSCIKGEDYETPQKKLRKTQRCIDIRRKIMKACFRGGDDGHRQQVKQEINRALNCLDLINS